MSDAAKKIAPFPQKPKKQGPGGSLHETNNRVLVVEDEKSVASAYQSILSPTFSNVIPFRRSSRIQAPPPSRAQQDNPEFEVTVTFSAREALEQMQKSVQKEKPFAMAFVDVLLGKGMDGIELTKKLYEIDPSIYVVFVTAYSDRSVDSIQEYLGAENKYRWDYLNKPFSDGEILQKARNAVAWWNMEKEKLLHEKALAQANRRLINTERLTSVAAVARSVSHEFGNILVQIMGRAELGKDGDEKQMRESLETILKASETASAILDRFKTLGNDQEIQSQKAPISYQDVLQETLMLLEHQFKKLQVKTSNIKNEKFRVLASRSSLVQVLVNLIINALHAMEKGGNYQFDFTIQKTKDVGEIIVRDYGSGIDEKHLPQVTEAFFTTKQDKGTGLGLAISKEIIEIEHHGEFIVRNNPICGAEVVIRLPLAKEDD